MRDSGRPVYLGVDVGSVSTNLVLLDAVEPRPCIVWKAYLRTQGAPLTASKRIGAPSLMRELGDCGVGQLAAVGNWQEWYWADWSKTRSLPRLRRSCIDSGVSTIFGIGGQDSSLIILRDGVVVDFAMNTVCAAGTGSFLDQQAFRLGVPIEDLGELALRSRDPVRIAGRCTVFAESDMVHKQQLGVDTADIVAGLCAAMVRNFLGSLAKGKELRPTVFFPRRVAANAGMRRAFEEALGQAGFRAEHYDVMGAVGIALLVREALGGKAVPTRFAGLERVLDSQVASQSYECTGCPNSCEICEVWRDGIFLASWGARCGRQGRTDQTS